MGYAHVRSHQEAQLKILASNHPTCYCQKNETKLLEQKF